MNFNNKLWISIKNQVTRRFPSINLYLHFLKCCIFKRVRVKINFVNIHFYIYQFRACSHRKSIKNHSQHDNRKKNWIELIVACKNFSETLDSEKITFYLVPLFVKFFIILPGIFTIFFGGTTTWNPCSSAKARFLLSS